MALELKNKGNQLYNDGDYQGAEECYSQAILKDPKKPAFYSNRALVRLKLQMWTGAEQDSRRATELYGSDKGSSIKPQFYLAQALFNLGRHAEAHSVALAGYNTSVEMQNRNMEPLSKMVLQAKHALWAAKETARLRQQDDTLRQLEELVATETERESCRLQKLHDEGDMGSIGHAEDQARLQEDKRKTIQNVREVFAAAKGAEMKERVVPPYFVDSITFEIMHDPVITPSGHSFDRSSIVHHLQRNPFDPITRAPMTANDLRPNYALKEACTEFLEQNGWAVDW